MRSRNVQVSTLGNFTHYNEKLYMMRELTKSKVDKITKQINDDCPKSTTLDKNNPKDFNFDAVTSEEVWAIAKKYCLGYSGTHIADYVQCKREEEYKKITGNYAEKKIKFPVNRVTQIIKLLDK